VTDAPERLLAGEAVEGEPARPRRLAGTDDPTHRSARVHEYSRAANPVGAGITPPIPLQAFPASLHTAVHETAVIPLDVSAELGVTGPATSPALCAAFVRLVAGTPLITAPEATSELVYVLAGSGTTATDDGSVEIHWARGDAFVLPAGLAATHRADADATWYRVTDEPLLRHLGVTPTEARFPVTHFPAAWLDAELALVEAAPHAEDRNRISVLLATAEQTRTLTITHVLWAMYGVVPAGAVQRPHRHQSVALDLIIDAPDGCYTLVGRTLDAAGEIVDPVRVDWESAGAFITPPGLWHAHHNESAEPAYLLPVQDAGLHTHLRTLDIRFG
jgi:gentisate 1,2-dioxygenase